MVPVRVVRRIWLGEGRDMETNGRTDPTGDREKVRGEQVPSAGNSSGEASGLSSRIQVEVSEALGGLTDREREIFHAGVLYGAAHAATQGIEQLSKVTASASRAATANAAASLTALQGAANHAPPTKSAEWGARLGGACRRILGRSR